jgi:phosphoribosylanthranilate isomerase
MPDPYVKICGITRMEDAQLAVAMGASALGFIFWPDSPRYVDPVRARAILSAVPGTPGIGVFVDQPLEAVRSIARTAGLAAIQLHGSESAVYARALEHPVIKAVSVIGDESIGADVTGNDVISNNGEWDVETLLLLDAYDPVLRGGTGRIVDWRRAAAVAAGRRVILSGGLRPANVALAIATIRPYAVDVSSGVEEAPGRKDPDKLRAFMKAVGPIRPGPLVVTAAAESAAGHESA